MKKFIKTKAITGIIVVATILLAGVAIFTALRLYQLGSEPVSPASPEESVASTYPLQISPNSGNWNYPESFTVKNVTTQTKTVNWFLDCWDTSVCSDSTGTEILAPNESFEKGLGNICTKWQLDLHISEDSEYEWGGISESKVNCETPPVACQQLTFSLSTPLVTTTVTLTPTPTLTPTLTPTATPTSTPTPSLTSSPTPTTRPLGGTSPTPTLAAQATPTPTQTLIAQASPTSIPGTQAGTGDQLPEAGVSIPTIFSIAIGILLIISAFLFAL